MWDPSADQQRLAERRNLILNGLLEIERIDIELWHRL